MSKIVAFILEFTYAGFVAVRFVCFGGVEVVIMISWWRRWWRLWTRWWRRTISWHDWRRSYSGTRQICENSKTNQGTLSQQVIPKYESSSDVTGPLGEVIEGRLCGPHSHPDWLIEKVSLCKTRARIEAIVNLAASSECSPSQNLGQLPHSSRPRTIQKAFGQSSEAGIEVPRLLRMF